MHVERPAAVVMNMFYTGLGIARSLGSRGIPVIGLSAQSGVYGNATRYAKVLPSPDSKAEPEAFAAFLSSLAGTLGHRAILFPTRDHDVVFLDRYRAQLEPLFHLVIPPEPAVRTSLDKWETFAASQRAAIPAPRCWPISGEASLRAALAQLSYPCVLKPLAAHHWREAGKWAAVGERKAIGIESEQQLRQEYARIVDREPRALIQEMIPGDDDALVAIGCYVDRRGAWAGGFALRKLIQSPSGFGTGCVLQAVEHPELIEKTKRLLAGIGFGGIAEVEYKRHALTGEYLLIEINPRPWDQFTLGVPCGVDVSYLAYCDFAGLPMPNLPVQQKRDDRQKWVAEDTFLITLVRLLAHGDPLVRRLPAALAGKRNYAIWSWRDPAPFLLYLVSGVPALIWSIAKAALSRPWRNRTADPKRAEVL